MMNMGSLEEYWSDLRRGLPKAKRAFPGLSSSSALPTLRDWMTSPRTAFQVIPGDEREEVLALMEAELPDGSASRWASPWSKGEKLIPSFLRVVRDLPIPPSNRSRQAFQFALPHPQQNPAGWDLLWGFVARTSFVVEEPLRGMINRRPLADMYRVLVEARFEAQEKKDWGHTSETLSSVGRWIEGDPKPTGIAQTVLPEAARFEMAFFLLTLASQNGLLGNTFLILDGLERATPEDAAALHHMLSTLSRWVEVGCPLRLILGWDAKSKNALRKLHPRLYLQVREGLRWAKSSQGL